MRYFFAFFLLLPAIARGQNITTIAGTGAISNTGDGGPASAASLNIPGMGKFDRNGDYYIAMVGNRVRKISRTGVITTIAGGGSGGDGGSATTAFLNIASDVAFDTSGNLYIAESNGSRVRKVDHITGIITTYAGNGIYGTSGDNGPATNAQLGAPEFLCFDKWNNLYISDYMESRIRRVSASGIITTFAGTVTAGYNGDEGRADTSQIKAPSGIFVDNNNNVYFGDNANARLRMIDSSGIIHTIAGNGTFSLSGDGGPATSATMQNIIGVHKDISGNIYFSDGYPSHCVRKISPSGIITRVAGVGTIGFGGDGGRADTAKLNNPCGITTDSCGNLIIVDNRNYRIRKVTFDASCNQTDTNTSLGLAQSSTAHPSMDVYPNPATTYIHITGLSPAGGLVQVYDLSGRLLQQQVLTSPTPVNIASLLPGTYQVVITDTATHKRQAVRLVKE